MTRTTKTATRDLMGILALGAAALLGATAPASAQGGEPDLGHYCRATYGSHARAVFRHGAGAWTCAEQRGFERRYHRVDFADACRLTFGANGFRPAGAGATCLGTAADGSGPGTETRSPGGDTQAYRQIIPNLSGYCRKTYGRGTRVAFDPSTGLYMCAGRDGVAYRRIDMAEACFFTVRTTNFRFDGDRREIRCLVSV